MVLQGGNTIPKRWYSPSSGIQPHPSLANLDKVLDDYKAIYLRDLPSPSGRPFPTHAGPSAIEYLVLTEG